MVERLSDIQDESIGRVREVLGLTAFNLVRSVLSYESDEGALGLHLVVPPEFSSKTWTPETVPDLQRQLQADPMVKVAEVRIKGTGQLSVFVRFAFPADEPPVSAG